MHAYTYIQTYYRHTHHIVTHNWFSRPRDTNTVLVTGPAMIHDVLRHNTFRFDR